MLAIAKGMLEKEATQSVADKASHMAQTCPELSLPHSMQELQVRHIPSYTQTTLRSDIHTNDVYHIVKHKEHTKVWGWIMKNYYFNFIICIKKENVKVEL